MFQTNVVNFYLKSFFLYSETFVSPLTVLKKGPIDSRFTDVVHLRARSQLDISFHGQAYRQREMD